ncbi:MAG: homoserine dehydrogenase [Negativicutes bacterium]|jgi:homoserine dehydrogenase|nr:homoserine dehydrogenase [Negativicutes bacterium]
MSKTINIALLGLGTVGQGIVNVLKENNHEISQKVGFPINIKTVLVRNIEKAKAFDASLNLTTDFSDIINDAEINIVVEVMGGENPARQYMLQALQAKKHVITANKDVVALHGREMFEAATAHKVDFMFEASVGGGIPIIRPLKQCLTANKITEVMGIVNGTTNYMLTKMSNEGMDYNQVLKEAQEKGYAESDPTADVGGLDAARKLAILSSIAFNTKVSLNDVYVEGITKITPDDIKYAKELGYVVKLLAIAKDNVDNGIEVRVHPAFISNKHPLSAVNDVFNAIYINGNAVGEAMFYGRGAGSLPTASAVVADVIDVARNIVHDMSGRILCTCFEDKKIASIDESISSYYIRLLVKDEPGVLALIAGAFGDQKVSLGSVIQKQKLNNQAELVLLTGAISDVNIQKALTNIKSLNVVTEVYNVIRVEE